MQIYVQAEEKEQEEEQQTGLRARKEMFQQEWCMNTIPN